MKLVIITAVNQYKDQIKNILKNANVPNYVYNEVTGHRDTTNISDEGNWFAGSRIEGNSILFHVFTSEENTEKIFKEIKEFNSHLETLSKLHISVLNIEKTN